MNKLSTKEITIDGRTFQIRKFPPDVGVYWASKFFGTNVVGANDNKEALALKLQNFINKQRAEFKEFQADCLKCVYELLPARPTCAINPEGNYGIEVDGPLLFQLVYHSFMFTIADFFNVGVLSSLSGSTAEEVSTESNTEQSMNSSIPQSDSDIGNSTNSGTEHTL